MCYNKNTKGDTMEGQENKQEFVQGQEVFGINGERYIFEGMLHNRPLVRSVYYIPSSDGDYEETGDIIQIEKVYVDPPIKAFDDAICDRQTKISELDQEIKKLERDIQIKADKLLEKQKELKEIEDNTIPETLKRLTGISNIDVLIKALKGELTTYAVKNEILTDNSYQMVGIQGGNVILLQRDSEGLYHRPTRDFDIDGEKCFFTKEEAEQEVLGFVMKHPDKVTYSNLERIMCIDAYFIKYNVERPDSWKKIVDKAQQNKIKDIKQAIKSRESYKEHNDQELKKLYEDLALFEESLKIQN